MLRERQQQFAAAVFEADGTIHAHLRADRFTPAQHLQIYRNNVVASLTAALAAVYPVVQRLVGEGFFRYAAHEYLRAHRPPSGNLHDFGGALAGFLAQFAPAAGLPYLADVARLEWAYHEAFHAAETARLDLAALANVAPADCERLHFTLHPSARLIQSPFPILRIWEVNQEGYAGDPTVSLDAGVARVLVIRHHLTVQLELLAPGEFALLDALARDASLSEAAAAALAANPDTDLTTLLQRHVAAYTLVHFTLKD
jgi:hypothetical protein